MASGNSRNEVSVFPGADHYAAGLAPYTDTDNDVTISSRVVDVPGRNVDVLTHEFGHVLGFDHSDDPRSVMYGQSQSASQSANETIQGWEVAQLRTFWGFDEPPVEVTGEHAVPREPRYLRSRRPIPARPGRFGSA